MRKKTKGFTLIELLILIAIILILGIILLHRLGYASASPPKSSSGVKKITTNIKIGSDGLTVEQRNVKNRINKDNIAGEIKHLYIISPYSGQVIIYSTVKGKVTSSGKRLSPYTVQDSSTGFMVNFGGLKRCTSEVLEDDGTYGSSVPYIYWWDSRGIYHQHFFTGGQIIHLSDQPITVKNIIINMELNE